MALPMIQATTEPPDWDVPDLSLLSDSDWSEVEEPAIAALLTEILGYELELITAGATTQAAVNAMDSYRDLMQTILGYVLEEIPDVSSSVQEALNEIASGQTTVVYSTEELEEHLRGRDSSD